MKVFLLFKDHDFKRETVAAPHEGALKDDLEMDALFGAMSQGDEFLYEAASQVVLHGWCHDPAAILYRQDILKDCLRNPAIIREIHQIAIEAIEERKKHFWGYIGKYPSGILHSSIDVMKMFAGKLRTIRNIADEQSPRFDSEGFKIFFSMIRRELDDDFFAMVNVRLRELKFRNGVLISAELGEGNKGINYVLRKPKGVKPSWLERLSAVMSPGYSFAISDRDESGARALSELNDRGIHLAANALAQSNDHIQSYFNMLRTELAFYIGCLNLHDKLVQMGAPVSFPLPAASGERKLSFSGLYDICLALVLGRRIVGNDVNADKKELMIITGANQGGKSTFLRSIGLAQLMMQSGMFVPAESFCSDVCDHLFTHFKREEDNTMSSGKLDEELSRMSEIIDNITSDSMLLLNESFAATNEREGSEIARQIISALLEKRIRVFFVTHLHDFAHGIYDKNLDNAIFLRAERQADGGRTFKLLEGEPLQTSYGEDLYNSIFGGEVL